MGELRWQVRMARTALHSALQAPIPLTMALRAQLLAAVPPELQAPEARPTADSLGHSLLIHPFQISVRNFIFAPLHWWTLAAVAAALPAPDALDAAQSSSRGDP